MLASVEVVTTLATILELLVSCWLVLAHHARHDVSWIAFFAILSGLVLSLSILVTLPLDMVLTLTAAAGGSSAVGGGGASSPPSATEGLPQAWEAMYWTVFALCWILYPILAEYERAGDFTFRDRLKRALRKNLLFYMAILLVTSLVTLYMGFTPKGDFSTHWSGLIIAIANTWGLFAITLLLGYGLIAIPRHLFKLANPSQMLYEHCIKATTLEEARLCAKYDFLEAVRKVRSVASQTNPSSPLRPYVDELVDMVERHPLARAGGGSSVSGSARDRETTTSRDIGRERLINLRADVKRCLAEAERAECRWKRFCQTCFLLEDLVDDALHEDCPLHEELLDFGYFLPDPTRAAPSSAAAVNGSGGTATSMMLSPPMDPETAGVHRSRSLPAIVGGTLCFMQGPWCRRQRRRMMTLWHKKLRRPVCLMAGVTAAILSLAILVGEASMFAQDKVNLSPLAWAIHATVPREPAAAPIEPPSSHPNGSEPIQPSARNVSSLLSLPVDAANTTADALLREWGIDEDDSEDSIDFEEDAIGNSSSLLPVDVDMGVEVDVVGGADEPDADRLEPHPRMMDDAGGPLQMEKDIDESAALVVPELFDLRDMERYRRRLGDHDTEEATTADEDSSSSPAQPTTAPSPPPSTSPHDSSSASQSARLFGLHTLILTLLTYMVMTSYWGVFQLKLAGWYGLYTNHNTDTNSLIFCTAAFCRLAAPVCFHFVLLADVPNTAFEGLYGQMRVVPVFGSDELNLYFPIAVVLLAIVNLLNLYQRFVRLLGLRSLEFDVFSGTSDTLAGQLTDAQEGRAILARERQRRLQQLGVERPSDTGGAARSGTHSTQPSLSGPHSHTHTPITTSVTQSPGQGNALLPMTGRRSFGRGTKSYYPSPSSRDSSSSTKSDVEMTMGMGGSGPQPLSQRSDSMGGSSDGDSMGLLRDNIANGGRGG